MLARRGAISVFPPSGNHIMQIVYDYFYYYQRFLLKSWHNMTPMQYGYLLVTIAVVGWIMMKSQQR